MNASGRAWQNALLCISSTAISTNHAWFFHVYFLDPSISAKEKQRKARAPRPTTLTFLGPVEKRGHIPAIGHARISRPEFVKEGVADGLDSGEPSAGRVLQQTGDEVDRIGGRARAKDLGEGVRPDLRELVFHVVRVHRLDLLARRRS